MSLLHKKLRNQDDPTDLTGRRAEVRAQKDQNSTIPPAPRRRSSALKFFTSSGTAQLDTPQASHKKWEADYLKDLRTNRPARPGGSRPLPERATLPTPEPYVRALSAMSFRPLSPSRQSETIVPQIYERSASALSHRRTHSDMPEMGATIGFGGLQSDGNTVARDFSTSTTTPRSPRITPSGIYRESGMRWMEKQEARSLREALEDMDMMDEAKIHAAAQFEASELVWKHRNPDSPRKDPYKPYNYKSHLQAGAHLRSQSTDLYAASTDAAESHPRGHDSLSDQSRSSQTNGSQSTGDSSATSATGVTMAGEAHNTGEDAHISWDPPHKKAYMKLASSVSPRKSSNNRRSSTTRARDGSGGPFRNPDDRIYEEPDPTRKPSPPAEKEQSRIPGPLGLKTRNTIAKTSTASQPFLRSRVASAEDKKVLYRAEIHRNPPSQSRNPSYRTNGERSIAFDRDRSSGASIDRDKIARPEEKEIRSDDIRAATSRRARDRSPKLPSPTVVSDRPGRPIVSFEKDWKPKDTGKEENVLQSPSAIPPRLRFKPHMPESTASAPIIPTINVSDTPSIQISENPDTAPPIPTISVSDAPVPTISLPDDPPRSRALPNPSDRARAQPASRPLPHHSSIAPVHQSKLHWSPSSRRATAQCAACALSIEGRIVSAASQRFHPHCFTCHHCAEPLECVAFYPEPDTTRSARLARIEARADGTAPSEGSEKPGETALDDGDSGLRFYCHLDFHELFSPRCRSCKTPIESEVVLACGGSWHVGHFFCAECGDPFDAKTPFIEKNGYAWCVNCHAGRFSGKCKGCRKPVVDGGVVALGGEWHATCFCCVECGGQFEDGRFFTREHEAKPVCVGCEERRLKA